MLMCFDKETLSFSLTDKMTSTRRSQKFTDTADDDVISFHDMQLLPFVDKDMIDHITSTKK